jgi:hypothetical protein
MKFVPNTDSICLTKRDYIGADFRYARNLPLLGAQGKAAVLV